MSRKKKYKIPIWKHSPLKNTSTDLKFIQVYHDLLLSEDFLSLKFSSKVIYFYMYDYSLGERDFIFPYSIYSKITTKETFQKAINELTQKGFIEIIETGKNTRTPNKYRFSSKWYSNK